MSPHLLFLAPLLENPEPSVNLHLLKTLINSPIDSLLFAPASESICSPGEKLDITSFEQQQTCVSAQWR